MKIRNKILLLWLCVVTLTAISFFLFDHKHTNFLSYVVNLLLVLLGIVSFFVFLNEPSGKNKSIFLNFSVYFLLSISNLIYPFIGHSIFPGDPYASLYFYQYVGSCLIVAGLSFSIAYVVLDTLFNEFSNARKRLIAFALVATVCGYYYAPIFSDPMFVYKTEDIIDFKTVDKTVTELREGGISNPGANEIAAKVRLHAWNESKPVGLLFEEENLKRISFILPYIEGDNYSLLLMKPVHLNIIYLNVFSLVFLFLFFGYQYKNDPPQGAYIEKILFLFLPYLSLDILHFYAYVSSNSYETYAQLYGGAQYLVIFNLLLLLVFFSLRLHFIGSVKGEFYERELVLDSEHISRWRDGIDNLVVRHFLNPKTFHGRLFTPREARSKT